MKQAALIGRLIPCTRQTLLLENAMPPSVAASIIPGAGFLVGRPRSMRSWQMACGE